MDAVTRTQKLLLVKEQMQLYAGRKVVKDDYSLICCPYHDDSTPSGRVFHSATSYSPGSFKCYGCPAKATWNELADRLGLKPFKRGKPQEEHANANLLALSVTEAKKEFIKERIKFRSLPKNSSWRGFHSDFLNTVGAKLCKTHSEDYGWSSPKLYLPCLVNGELVGYIKAALAKTANVPSYINAKGAWSKTKGLYPFDTAIALMNELSISTIVLVEGPRDALRLIRFGIPAMCILGVQSWSDAKAKLLELAGVETVILLMDGDCAGIEAVDLIKPTLKKFFTVKVVKLWAIKGSPYIPYKDEEKPTKVAKEAGVSLWDPCSCPKWILRKIKSKYLEGG